MLPQRMGRESATIEHFLASGHERPRVSVIVPVRNEERYIRACLSQLFDQDYPTELLEIVVVDCLSEDRTREIIQGLRDAGDGQPPGPAARPLIRLIDDPGQERTTALNAGIKVATGEVIMRVDARSIVPLDYVRKCVETLDATGADNVGGIQQPIGDAPMQEAIGLAMSHPFGVGNAQFRVGKKSGFVDTVYLGTFRRDVFHKIGLFDDDVPVLSEDSDINQRIHDRGGTVYLNTEIRIPYYPRETLKDFIALYFRYGLARAGNLMKHRKLTAWRQAVPPLFVLLLAVLGLLALIRGTFLAAFATVLGTYLLVDVAASAFLSVRRGKWHLLPRLLAVFPSMHFGWALGFFDGLLVALDRKMARRQQPS
jgi:succinoglycan biosynthesis protein ExoA